jgi:hypothetical protein
MAWFGLGRTDRELAATKYAGRESATDQARRKQAERGSMGRPARSAATAANTGEDYRLGRKTPKPRRFTRGG